MEGFSEDEKIIARNIDQKYKWMVRDKSGSLHVYSLKPVKRECVKMWGNSSSEIARVNVLFNKELFRTIKWEDDEPTLIRDIYDPQILDYAEREYIKSVIKPFHEKIEFVGKYGDEFSDDGTCHKEFLFITYGDGDRDKGDLTFPDFDAGKMYSGMKLGKSYTLDELGITYKGDEE